LLRISVEEDGFELRLLLEGRLEEALILEVEKAFAEQTGLSAGRPVVVDLAGLTGMDEAGESSLRKLYEQGATLRCADVMNTYLVEQMAHGPLKPLQAPCRPSHSNETLNIKPMEEK
jgi:hypothetical protein